MVYLRGLGADMLLRNITKHVKDQNWFAVALDFFIVVVGVFIGIQVANWNEVKSNKAGLVGSLERLDKEVSRNIDLIEKVLVYYREGANDMSQGRAALDSCDASAEGQAALVRLMFDFVEDVQPNFVTVALDQLANEARYQDLLTPQFQQDFGTYAGRLQEEHEQLTSHYDNMWTYHVNYHPSVTAVFPTDPDGSDAYQGWAFKLDKPFEEVCADASFRTRFINTLGFYSAINRRLVGLKEEVETFQVSLAKELENQ